ncbi:hypothetical protein F2P44_20185 [Massilia sp. CCM 8695]|uniref:DUF2569 family protein n=1 Tax=Massilia frigida TaxID=2609281 RepID=A0ABX0NG04_9BURK|nr:hypothetical protein [Massilia frigida]NHZ81577.1 hypothetical protein [Massilia frigida]
MRTFSYWLCFGLVVPSYTVGPVLALLQLAGMSPPGAQLFGLLSPFGSLVPGALGYFLPSILSWLLFLVMLALVARRIWLCYARGERVPPSYAGLTQVLGYIGTVSFIIAAIVMVLAIVLKAGSGVPAGMALIPAMFCIPWAFFLTELFSFRKRAM